MKSPSSAGTSGAASGGAIDPTSAPQPIAVSGFRHFHEQLAKLRERLLTMSDRAEGLVELSVDALLKRDRDRADAVIAGDRELDDLEVEVESLAVELLALQQPMARDLRFIVSAIKIASDLERVGDHAVNIAQCSLRLIAMQSTLTPEPEIEDMARRARRMLSDALDAFVRGDGVLGREVCLADDYVDALLNSVFRILLTHMMADARAITPSLELILVGRNLERVADLATNIGEDAVFLAEGKQIKHRFEQRERERLQAAMSAARGGGAEDDDGEGDG
jgi:phosphate transport system protein